MKERVTKSVIGKMTDHFSVRRLRRGSERDEQTEFRKYQKEDRK